MGRVPLPPPRRKRRHSLVDDLEKRVEYAKQTGAHSIPVKQSELYEFLGLEMIAAVRRNNGTPEGFDYFFRDYPVHIIQEE